MTSLSTGGNTLWGLGDHLGSLRDIADLNEGTGVTSVTNHRTYNAFGKLTAETNSAVDMLFGFTGKQLDDATGLQHNLFRWYDAAIGQWMSEDPIGFAAGDSNSRRYVNNQALAFADPTGLFGDLPNGTPENNYHGLGEWPFADAEKIKAFIRSMVESDGTKLPKGWEEIAKNGCIGLCNVRVNFVPVGFTAAPLMSAQQTHYLNLEKAKAVLEKMRNDEPTKDYRMYAAQLFVIGKVPKGFKTSSDDAILLKKDLDRLKMDMEKLGDFNFGTWFPMDTSEYWEYMNHGWDWTKDPPKIIHSETLPEKFDITLYGIVATQADIAKNP